MAADTLLPMPQHPVEVRGQAGLRALTPLFQDYFRGVDREYLCVAGFDRWQRLIQFAECAGRHHSVTGTIAAVRTVLGNAAVTSLVLAHNHPHSGIAPSFTDCRSTRTVIALANAAGASVTDHLIFGAGQWLSFRDEGLM